MQILLTEKEIRELTGRTHRVQQRGVLDYMGIPYKTRPDSSLAVLREAVKDKLWNVQKRSSVGEDKKSEPNWSKI